MPAQWGVMLSQGLYAWQIGEIIAIEVIFKHS